MRKLSSLEEHKQLTSFQSLSKTLRQDAFADHRTRPLAHWAIASDRRLPLALLGRTIQELIDTPFDVLADTPGVGRKKIASLLKLLSRAAKDEPVDRFAHDGAAAKRRSAEISAAEAEFDPATVSEAVWEQWRTTVGRHRLEEEKLGRLAPSLQTLPTVIWHTPLSAYLNSSLANIRKLKTHGDKRVSVVLQVFHAVHQVLGQSELDGHLALRIEPKFVAPVERWIDECLDDAEGLSKAAVRDCLAAPLVDQVRLDCGATIARLAEGRLGINGPQQDVRTQAKRMGVTRARIYQLLEQCQAAINVRWPQGRRWVTLLRHSMESTPLDADSLQLLRDIEDFFYPTINRRRATAAEARG